MNRRLGWDEPAWIAGMDGRDALVISDSATPGRGVEPGGLLAPDLGPSRIAFEDLALDLLAWYSLALFAVLTAWWIDLLPDSIITLCEIADINLGGGALQTAGNYLLSKCTILRNGDALFVRRVVDYNRFQSQRPYARGNVFCIT